jgi:radical SAM family uncharacterized protein
LQGSDEFVTAQQLHARLSSSGEKVGLAVVHLYRPFPAAAFVAALPDTVRAVAVLDRTKEPGAPGEPLYLDVVAALAEHAAQDGAVMPRVVGGRYGLGSKEFTPAMAAAVLESLAAEPRHGFTVGIADDVTHRSLAVDRTFTVPTAASLQAVFWGLGSDGTVSANKSAVKILGEGTDLHAQGYFVIDSKKSGSITESHLRVSPEPIRATYLVDEADFVACHQFGFLTSRDVLARARQGATFLLNCPYPAEEVWDHLPVEVQEAVLDKDLRFWVVDAARVAREAGLGGRINTVMQPCFFALSGLMPAEQAIARLKDWVSATFGKRGEEVVRRNHAALDAAVGALAQVEVPAAPGAAPGGVYVPGFYDVEYLPDGRIRRYVPTRPEAPWRVGKHTVMDLDQWEYPRTPLVPLAESVHERMSVEIFRGCTRGCRFCQAGMITRPVRERSIEGIGRMVDSGLTATGFEEVGLLSLSSADHSEIGEIAKGLADRYEDTRTGLSLPSTRVDAFNIDLANELSRNGRRSGLTFAPEGGSERIRRVINKMVTEEDLIRTVTAAYEAGWRHVKLYFMCGLPTETDEDVLQIADVARRVIESGRQVTGRTDIKCTVSIGGFVPKPHTPFQWAPQLGHEQTDDRLAKLRAAIRSDRRYAKAIGVRYHDGRPGIVEGLLARGDRRVADVVEAVWRDGGRFDGWSEHFSFDRWAGAAQVALAPHGVDLDWFTTRERGEDEVLPWDHLDSGLDREWLWADWQDAVDEVEVDDCRWSPCFQCGVCPSMGTEIQVGPTGRTLLPLSARPPTAAAVG